ncbi:Flagellar basal-body rod modification protein FlgD [Roseibacterium elongatum DSM 19469]|uniref:Basal-body rod modification protein FlgD n=1 Tax=Roseicyclus elongatus DSM 19469 TaxID=1294273 RepID=W8RR83_9RHOB|nr:flagellar hook capping FlgD N-terminal domain-containing protein [Roseibacterium elongatum]AHM03694.1 Flagellar basal-body rod modification protein FlgD [Roseibacterium elongatum DSM 19469]
MEIFPTTARQSPTGLSAAQTNQTVLSADFQTFLQLLTTQMQNQDPLNPMESTEYATQLATFSGVEQQVLTNDLLAELQAGLGTLGMGELGGWIGMEARAEMPVYFEGQTVTLQAVPNQLADRAELLVRNEAGEVVQRLPIPLSDQPFEWTGEDLDGATLEEGIYSFSIESWQGEDLLDERNVMVRAEIEEAQLVNGAVWLTVEGGLSIPAEAVLGLRNPSI